MAEVRNIITRGGIFFDRPPRDLNGMFDPVTVEKHISTLNGGLDKKITVLYGKGNSMDDIHYLLKDKE